MFVGREVELEKLESSFNSPSASLDLIFGSQYSGKTALVNHFSTNKSRIYFSSFEMIPSAFFTQMANKITQFFYQSNFNSTATHFEQILQLFAKYNYDQKIVIVFDDFHQILKVDKEALNTLIEYWKKKLSKKNIQIIISSSLIFEDNSLNKLIKLSSQKIELNPLPFSSIRKFFPNISQIDHIYLYSLLGTSPYFLKYYNPKKEFSENVYNLFLSNNGFLSTLGIDILKSELNEIGTYGSILNAIAQGNTKIGDIANTLELKSTYLTRYLNKLVSMMVIKKVVPINEELQGSKFGRYTICDNAVKFWFSYIYTNITSLREMDLEVVTQLIQNKFVTQTVSQNYKNAIKEYVFANQERIFGYKPSSIGSWWDNSDHSIDIVAYDKKTITFVQIFWESKEMAKVQYSNLKRTSELFDTTLEKKYIIVTKESLFNIA